MVCFLTDKGSSGKQTESIGVNKNSVTLSGISGIILEMLCMFGNLLAFTLKSIKVEVSEMSDVMSL